MSKYPNLSKVICKLTSRKVIKTSYSVPEIHSFTTTRSKILLSLNTMSLYTDLKLQPITSTFFNFGLNPPQVYN